MDYGKVLSFLGESVQTKKIKDSDIGDIFVFNINKDGEHFKSNIIFEFNLESILNNNNFAGSLDYLNNLEMPYDKLALCVEANAIISLKVFKTKIKNAQPLTAGKNTPYDIIFDKIEIVRIFSSDMSNDEVIPKKVLQPDHLEELKHLQSDILNISKQLILQELDSVDLLNI